LFKRRGRHFVPPAGAIFLDGGRTCIFCAPNAPPKSAVPRASHPLHGDDHRRSVPAPMLVLRFECRGGVVSRELQGSLVNVVTFVARPWLHGVGAQVPVSGVSLEVGVSTNSVEVTV